MFKNILSKTTLKISIFASILSSTWGALLSILFVPIYLRYIGPEAYGLIGVFASLQVVLSLLDSGLSTTLNKEIASLSVLSNSQQQIRNLVKTLGNIYWGLALFAGLIAVGLSPILSNYWVQPKELSLSTVTTSFVLLSISLVFQLPIGFYSGGLLGLKRQVPLSIINISLGTLRSFGAVIILIFFSKSVIIFFLWSVIINVIQALLLKYTLWHYLPKTNLKTIFDSNELRRIFHFAAGMMGISLTSILLTQIDKIILSKILPLEQFGYYSIACSLSLVIYQIIGPIVQSYFPRFSNLVSLNKIDDLKLIYHQACQVISLFVLPATFTLVFFSENLIFMWTNSSLVTKNTMLITAIYALGTGLNGLMNIPYYLTLSFGWTKLGLFQNIFLLILIIPTNIYLAVNYGAIGGAISWAIINSIYFLVTPFIIHRKILKGEAINWYLNDTIIPIIICIIVMSISKYFLLLTTHNHLFEFFWIAISALISILVILLFSSSLKHVFYNFIFKKS